jgi:hypothetical protein
MTGRDESFLLEVGLALIAVLEPRAAIVAPRASDDVDRLGEARIAGRRNRLDVVERAKDIVVPARRKGEAKEGLFLSRAPECWRPKAAACCGGRESRLSE